MTTMKSETAHQPANYRFSDKNELLLGDRVISTSFVDVIADITSQTEQRCYKLIKMEKSRGGLIDISIPSEVLLDTKKTLETLVKNGFSLIDANPEIVKYLKQCCPSDERILLEKLGWIDESDGQLEYIAKNFQISKKAYLHQNISTIKMPSLENWKKEVCSKCIGNPVLTLGLCTALLGTLLRFSNSVKSTIINLVGASSIGKTTVLNVANSVVGGEINQWRTTGNALESTANNHNDGLLILDELGQVNSREISGIVYMLGNGYGKARLFPNSSPKQKYSWRLSILSSGEIGVADKITESGERLHAGQTVRAIDIHVENVGKHGVFNEIYEFVDGANFANDLNEKSSRYQGIALKEFIKRLTTNTDIRTLQQDIKDNCKMESSRIIKKFDLTGANGQVLRVADIFSMLLVCGIKAVNMEIFPYTVKGITEEIYEIFSSWLKDRGGKTSQERQTIIDEVKAFFLKKDSQFEVLQQTKPSYPIRDKLGFVNKGYPERPMYYMDTTESKKIVNGVAWNTVKKILVDEGILGEAFDESGRVKQRMFNNTRKRLLQFTIPEDM